MSNNEEMVVAHDRSSGAKLYLFDHIEIRADPGSASTLATMVRSESRLPRVGQSRGNAPKLSWLIVPVCAGDNKEERLQVCKEIAATAL